MARIRHNPVGWLFVAPALLLILIFLVYPTYWTIRLSFYGGPGFIPTQFVALANYVRMFTLDPYFFNARNFPPTGALMNTIIWLFIFVPLAVGLGLIIAVMAEKVRYESIVKSVVFLPMGMSFTAAAIIWLFVYSPNPRLGLTNAILTALGGQAISFLGDVRLATPAIIVAAVWIWTGFCTVILSSALKGISSDVIEAALVDGASVWDIFFRIQVPMIGTTI